MRSLNRAAQVLAAVCLVLLAVMAGRPHFTNASRPPRGIRDPKIALEMARNIAEIDAIFADAPSPDREVMRIKLRIDFAFIAAYSLLALVLGEILASRKRGGRLVFWLTLMSAIFNARENSLILRILDTPLASTTQAMIDELHFSSVCKWALTAVAIAVVSRYWLATPRWFMRTIGGLELAGALLAAIGLRQNAVLPWSAALMAFGILLNAATLKFLPHESPTRNPVPRTV